MRSARWLGVCSVVLLGGAGVCAAQPGGPGERPAPRQGQGGQEPSGPNSPQGPFSPEALKARLERRLSEIQREEARLKEALEKLAKGEVVRPRDVAPGLGEGPGPNGRRADGARGRGPGGRGPDDGGGAGEARDAEPVLPLLREIMPDAAERVERAMKERPELARRMMQRVGPHLREAMSLKEHDPALFQLRVDEIRAGWGVLEAASVVRDAKQAKDDPEAAKKLEEARGKLREALGRQGDARLALEQHEVEALAKRVEDLRMRLDERRANKDKVLDDMIKRIEDARDLPMGALMGPEGRPPREGEPGSGRPEDR